MRVRFDQIGIVETRRQRVINPTLESERAWGNHVQQRIDHIAPAPLLCRRWALPVLSVGLVGRWPWRG